MSKVNKSIEIKDARITFVSLVDKAANKKSFLLTKQEGDNAGFQMNGRILKVDTESHFVTGVVYEPMVADAHDNFMTEEEIEKAAHWFMKNGEKVDIQHTFQQAEGLTVVESSVTKADQTIEGVEVKKGTWLMTIEVANDAVWKAIEDGDITGLSMGGIGIYAEEETELEKAEAPDTVPEKLNLLERLAKALGVESAVVKGEVRDRYEQRMRCEGFWKAWSTLHDTLVRYNYWDDQAEYEQDETKIRESLADFCDIITELLKGPDFARSLAETQPQPEGTENVEESADAVEKAGRKMSKTNRDKLNNIAQQLIDFAKEFDEEPDAAQDEPEDDADNTEEEEETEVNKEELQKMVDEAVQKALKPEEQPTEQQVEKTEELNAEAIQKMIDTAVEKAMQPVEKETEQAPAEEPLNTDAIQKMIDEALMKAFKQRGLASGMDDGSTGNVEKTEEQHYLHGLL